MKVININEFLDNETYQQLITNKHNCFLFFEDLTCLNWNNEKLQKNCIKIKEKYNITHFISYSDNENNFTFYRISFESNKG